MASKNRRAVRTLQPVSAGARARAAVSTESPSNDRSISPSMFDLLRTDARAVPPSTILALQRTMGNRAVSALIRGQRPSVSIQRLAYTTVVGDTWRTIGSRHGIPETDRTRFESMLTTNGRTWSNRGDTLRVGTAVQIPDSPSTTTTSSTTPTTVPSTPPPTVPTTGSMSTMMSAIGKFADWAAAKPGSKAALNFAFRVPVYEGVFVGARLAAEVERGDLDQGVAPLKANGRLEIEGRVKIPYYGEVDLSGALGGIIIAESKGGGQAVMESVTFAIYRKAQENNWVPARLMGWIWGSDRDAWAQGVAGRMVANDDKVLIGVVGEVSGKWKALAETGTDGASGVKSQVVVGTEYGKDSISGKGVGTTGGGYRGRFANTYNQTEQSIGETKASLELAFEGGAYGFTGGYKHSYEDGIHKGELTAVVDLKGLAGKASETERGKKALSKGTALLEKTGSSVQSIIAEARASVNRAGGAMGSMLGLINKMQTLGFRPGKAASVIKSALDGFSIPESVQQELDQVEADNEAKLEIKYEFAYTANAAGARPKSMSISLGGKLGGDSMVLTGAVETSRRLYKRDF